MQNLQQNLRQYPSPPMQYRPHPRPKPNTREKKHLPPKTWQTRRSKLEILGASSLATISFLFGMGYRFDATAATHQPLCHTPEQSTNVLSRQQLSQLLTIAERSPRQKIRSIVQAPYCQMAPIEVRSGVQAEREAYPLAFDPNTWLVVLYEGEEYAGYSFSFLAP
jgi:hypothetical protein